jgi:hypothetical protein
LLRSSRIEHQFVEYIPSDLTDGIIYVSIPYVTAIHRCACGCGKEVVTPLSPTDWRLIFDGQTISLQPSIGNWNFPCKSHYWITRNTVRWAPRLSAEAIEEGRRRDRLAKRTYFMDGDSPWVEEAQPKMEPIATHARQSLWQKLRRRLMSAK